MSGSIWKHPFLLSGVIHVLVAFFVFSHYGIVFETVDDYNVMMTISGEKTGSPYFQTTFYNSVLAFAISILYRITPAVQWYSLVELLFILSSLVVILGIVLEKCGRSKALLATALFVYLALFIALFLYPLQRMQFTSTAALLGAAATAVSFSLNEQLFNNKGIRKRIILICLFLVLSIAERRSAGLVTAVFVVAGFVKLWATHRVSTVRDSRYYLATGRMLILPGLVTVFSIVVIIVGHQLIMNIGDNAGYSEYDKWRVQYQDHPHATYEDATELFNSVGWDAVDYGLARSLIYIDQGINKTAFRAIVESQETKAAQAGPVGAIKLLYGLARDNIAAKSIILGLCALFSGCLCIIIFGIRRGRNHDLWKFLFLGLCGLVLLSAGLSFYVCLSGRWVLRTFQTIAFPLGAAMFVFFFELITIVLLESRMSFGVQVKGRHRKDDGRMYEVDFFASLAAKVFKSTIVLCCLVAFLFGMAFNVSENYIKTLAKKDSLSLERIASVEQWALDHPNDVFVHDYSICNIGDSYNPFRVNGLGSASNLVMSGGSYTYTGSYYKQLENNKLTRLDGETFLQENVFYITNPDRPGKYLNQVTSYLNRHYGEVRYELIAELDNNANVYKFTSGAKN